MHERTHTYLRGHEDGANGIDDDDCILMHVHADKEIVLFLAGEVKVPGVCKQTGQAKKLMGDAVLNPLDQESREKEITLLPAAVKQEAVGSNVCVYVCLRMCVYVLCELAVAYMFMMASVEPMRLPSA